MGQIQYAWGYNSQSFARDAGDITLAEQAAWEAASTPMPSGFSIGSVMRRACQNAPFQLRLEFQQDTSRLYVKTVNGNALGYFIGAENIIGSVFE
jgi:hypothetical protein